MCTKNQYVKHITSLLNFQKMLQGIIQDHKENLAAKPHLYVSLTQKIAKLRAEYYQAERLILRYERKIRQIDPPNQRRTQNLPESWKE